jgi:hypothetical protein
MGRPHPQGTPCLTCVIEQTGWWHRKTLYTSVSCRCYTPVGQRCGGGSCSPRDTPSSNRPPQPQAHGAELTILDQNSLSTDATAL